METGRFKVVMLAVAATSLCLALLAVFHHSHVLDSDEGVVLNGAWNLLHHKTPYLDFFEFVAPGSFYVVYWTWLCLGASYWSAKLLSVAAIALGALGVYRIGQLVLREAGGAAHSVACWLPPLLFCWYSAYWQAINHNTLSLAPGIWAVYMAARACYLRSLRAAAGAGLLCGLTILFLQHRGAAITLAIGFSLLLDTGWPARWRAILAFAAGAIAGSAALLRWPAALLIDDLAIFPANHYLEVNRVPLVLAALLATVTAAAAIRMTGGGAGRSARMLLAVQSVLLLAALQRPDLAHVTQAAFPLLALLPVMTALPAPRRSARVAAALAASGLLALTAFVRLPYYISDAPAAYREKLGQTIRRHCGPHPGLYAGPFMPGLYFETGTLNPTAYSVLLTNLNTEAQFDAAARDLARSAPACAVTAYAMVDKFGYHRRNPVDRYLADHYRVAEKLGPVAILVRNVERQDHRKTASAATAANSRGMSTAPAPEADSLR